MQDALRTFLRSLGEDPDREGLRETPERFEKTMRFLTEGYGESLQDIVDGALFPAESSEMVIIRDIRLHSLCEHHLLPFSGVIHVGYLPGEHLIGFSKIPRIVKMFSRRLQTQERLGHQICQAVEGILQPRGIGIVIDAEHLCMVMRGVQQEGSRTVTTHMRGTFESDLATRQEFLNLIRPKSSLE